MSTNTRLIIGLGKTGYSVASYWANQGLDFRVIDTRIDLSEIKKFKQNFTDVPLHTGSINHSWVKESQEIILSPGIDPQLVHQGDTNIMKVIYSDIDLFNHVANAPVIAITGSNGKSTVTMLIKHLLRAAGYQVKVGANLGEPALNLLKGRAPDFYVLELSSFQLSITQQIRTLVSIFLNLSVDHLERHRSFKAYYRAKQMIYRDCQVAIWNRDDPSTYPEYFVPRLIDFGCSPYYSLTGFSIYKTPFRTWLTQGKHRLLDVQSLPLKGTHNHLNILAALAAIHALPCAIAPLLDSLTHFQGLSHRLEYIHNERGITWINDSKATNSHATQAALLSFMPHEEGKIILIAGGVHKKGDNLTTLIPLFVKYVKRLILIGSSTPIFSRIFKGKTVIETSVTLAEAVQKASNYAMSDDIIILSPACASHDMFSDYAARGECFRKSVKSLYHSNKTYVN